MNPYYQYPHVIAPYYQPMIQVNTWGAVNFSNAPQYGGWSPNMSLFPPTFRPVQTGQNFATSQSPSPFPCLFSRMDAVPQPQNPVVASPTAFHSQFSQNENTAAPPHPAVMATSKMIKAEPAFTASLDSSNFPNTLDSELRENTTRRRNVTDIEDLKDANLAGTECSSDCTLILTEGRAAMSLAVTGLSVIGRNTYGLYAVKRRLVNACKSLEDKVKSDSEVKNITKILGLQYDLQYETDEEMRTLRYGKVILMMDRDEDASHMKGLIIILFYKFWPSLLRRNKFLMQFISPVIKVSCLGACNHKMPFYTVEEYEDWKLKLSNSGDDNKYATKHYRSLESFIPEEIKEFFSNFLQHCVFFRYENQEDDEALKLAFEKNFEDSRKDWLSETMRESFMYYEDRREIRYKDFINKELLFYSDLQNLRSLPSVIDGLTRSQRKVLHAYFKRHLGQEVSVLRLMGSVLEVSAYKQSMDALSQTIINMAQDFVGTNNINILMPIGQFGTRLHGGEDAGKSKYLYTSLNPIMKYIFSELDFPILSYREENDMLIEPCHYFPIIPMILVNGSEGIGTGYKTKIPKYDPKTIIENLLRMLDNLEPLALVPYFKGFQGEIESVVYSHFNSLGVISIVDRNRIRITDLPIGVWTESYKEDVLNNKLLGKNVLHYEEYHTDRSVDFLVTLRDPISVSIPELCDVFYLKGKEKSTFVAFDFQERVRNYGSPMKILEAYFDVRLSAYRKRKTFVEEKLQFHLDKLEALRKEIEYSEGSMITYNLQDRGYEFVYDTRRIQERGLSAIENDIRNTEIKLEELKQKSPEDIWREELLLLREELVASSLKTLSLE